jgi:hypothetical protein
MALRCHAECRNTECRNVPFIPSVVMLKVIMLSVIAPEHDILHTYLNSVRNSVTI